jgi:serine/threonine protein phosphatase PrpC
MSLRGWRYAAASVVGASHSKSASACQDSNDCQVYQLPNGESVLVGVVADGAGSSKYGGEGAALCCAMFIDLVSDHLSNGNAVDQISLDMGRFWLEAIKNRLSRQADSNSQVLREYACTLLGAVVGNSCAAFAQIGDGAIVVADSEELEYGHIFWPDRGEYENTTHFVTEDRVEEHLQFDLVRREIVEIAMLSDGLQRLALDYQSQTAHQPFFHGLFPAFQKSPDGRSEALSRALGDFLSSERVNQKTDDDKTLLLATRQGTPLDLGA